MPNLAMTIADDAGITPPASLRDRLLAWRDSLVASERFRAWAARFPLTRPIARRRAKQVFDLSAGFVYAQILSACVELDLFDILANGPQTPETLARRVNLSVDAAQRLLCGAIALQLLDRRSGGRVGLGPLGAAMVRNEAITAMVRHHTMFYRDMADPLALLRGTAGPTRLSAYWAYSGNPDAAALPGGEVAPYSSLMAASQPLVADEILDAARIGQYRCLLDVGGGDGRFLASAASRAPPLQVILFDLPEVAAMATQRFAQAGLSARARAVGGSFLTDPLPQGADAVSLVRVVHDHDDDAVFTILRAARRALPVGGTLILAEPMADTPGAQAMGDA